MDFDSAHLSGVPIHFNWFDLQLNQAKENNVKTTSVHSSSDIIVFPKDQSDNYQSQLCKSMHVLFADRGLLYIWTEELSADGHMQYADNTRFCS